MILLPLLLLVGAQVCLGVHVKHHCAAEKKELILHSVSRRRSWNLLSWHCPEPSTSNVKGKVAPAKATFWPWNWSVSAALRGKEKVIRSAKVKKEGKKPIKNRRLEHN